ncbi:hypothetical protein HH214_00865 [Mucilaginibacter robiniae]|uniref:Uncharacterized protein n=1 Tax=Mucilaginibacter robiniae TaxID=2728022 RepID=A0A7L5DTZ4_9SPHI|nr:hypothetical protein [Mucilaginibacter robiniae]QJD94522.1 hypothetical protein HH214_00865 [Mucilaginibacter robiniae]
METLKAQVVEQLKKDCTFDGSISSYMNQIMIRIPDADFDGKVKEIKQEVQDVVSHTFDHRGENLSVVIQCDDIEKEVAFTIWKTN